MNFRIVGPLEVSSEGRPVALGGPKQKALLCLLLLHANEVVSRDPLVDEVWAGAPPERAQKTLQVYVSRLRKALGGESLKSRSPGYVLRVEEGELDLGRFERLVAQGKHALAAGEPARAAASFRAALAVWRGPALADFVYESFAQAEIGRLEELRLSCVEDRIEADLAVGRHADLVGELEALTADHRRASACGHSSCSRIQASGWGDIDADGIDADAFEVRSDGSAAIALQGTAGRLALDLDGSGDADLAGLAAREARVAVGGSGDADVRADELLEVNIDGSGDVRYHGDPAPTQHVDGSGDLSRAD